jgi:hypothetical protein
MLLPRPFRAGIEPRLTVNLSAAREYWLWHSFRDVARRVGRGRDAAFVIMLVVRS